MTDTEYEIFCAKGNDYIVKATGLEEEMCDFHDKNVPIKFTIKEVMINDKMYLLKDVMEYLVDENALYTTKYGKVLTKEGYKSYPRYTIMVPLQEIRKQLNHTFELTQFGYYHTCTFTIKTPKYWKNINK